MITTPSSYTKKPSNFVSFFSRWGPLLRDGDVSVRLRESAAFCLGWHLVGSAETLSRIGKYKSGRLKPRAS